MQTNKVCIAAALRRDSNTDPPEHALIQPRYQLLHGELGNEISWEYFIWNLKFDHTFQYNFDNSLFHLDP